MEICQNCGTLIIPSIKKCQYCALSKADIYRIKNHNFKHFFIDGQNHKLNNKKILLIKIIKFFTGVIGSFIGILYIRYARYLADNWTLFDKDVNSKFYYYNYDDFKQLINLNSSIGISTIVISIIVTIILLFIKIGPERVIVSKSIPSQIEKYYNKINENEDIIKRVKNINKNVNDKKVKSEISETIDKLQMCNRKYNEYISQLKKYKYIIGIKAIYEVLEKGKVDDDVIGIIDSQNNDYINLAGDNIDDNIIKAYESLRIYAAKNIFDSVSNIKILTSDDIEEIDNNLRIQIRDLDYDIDTLNAEIELI